MISAARLAWLQLRRQKVRFAVAVAGVAFAVVLMFMQLGFRDALFRSAVNLHGRLNADVFLIESHYNIMAFPTRFSRHRLYQALALDGVASVSPLYTSLARWMSPDTGRTRDIFVMGVNPSERVLDLPGVEAHRADLKYADLVLFDEASRPEFGAVAAGLRAGRAISTEVSRHRVTVGGLFRLGTSFGIDGTIVTSDSTFLRIFPGYAPGVISIGLVRLTPGVDPRTVRAALAAALPRDVQVLTKQEFMDREVHYWATSTPIGYVFNFGVVMGIVVGTIVVYQILFADIADHLGEYATLKAMGYTNRFLAAVVVMEASLLALVGYLPGVSGVSWLYGLTESATMLPMRLVPARALLVFGLTTLMCWVSGLLAMRKLRAADPAEIF